MIVSSEGRVKPFAVYESENYSASKVGAFKTMQPFKPGLRYRCSSLPRLISFSLLLLFAATAGAQQLGSQGLLSQADEVFQQRSQITGLPIKAPLKKRVISR